MDNIPDKCLNCEHTIIQFEEVHKGWCKYEYESIVRCDCFPAQYKVGCVSAEVYCEKKGEINEGQNNLLVQPSRPKPKAHETVTDTADHHDIR